MVLFNERPSFDKAWFATSFRVVMGGMGDDTAMLIAEMYKRGYEPDEIVFCDTGSEFEHTYRFIGWLRSWCNEKKWSKVVVLRKWDKDGNPLSVIESAEKNNTLPAAAFGSKSCSLRFKVETADKYFNNHPKCHKAWGIEKKGEPLDSHTGSILRIYGLLALMLMSRNAQINGSQSTNGRKFSLLWIGILVKRSRAQLKKLACITPVNLHAFAALI